MLPNNWEYDDVEEEIHDIIAEVQKLPITEVLEAYGTKPESFNGIYVKALCPFHMDNKIGSFVINTEKNSCYCYSCANGGGVVKSVAKILNKSFSDAALQIACDKGLIDEKKFKKLSGVKYEPVSKEFKDSYEKQEEVETLSTRALKDSVYRFIANYFHLTKEHENHLLQKRGLFREDLVNYFSIDTEDKIKRKELLMLIEEKYSEKIDVIATKIPGFYYSKGKLDIIPKKGIGMLLHSARDTIVAIQIRADEVDERNSRYSFLSYKVPKSFEKWDMTGGCSAGTNFDVIYSKKPSKKLAIVEGKFKAEILAQNGFNVISVQGVNIFSGIETQLREIQRVLKHEFDKVTVFYDADFIRNPQVTAATIKLSQYLIKKEFTGEVVIAYWEPNLGKGIDDLIMNGYKKKVKTISADEYSNISQKSFTEALFVTGFTDIPQSKINKNDRTLILNEFESIMRKKFNILA